MLRTSDLDYHLPERLIATEPADPRESARLMVIHLDSGAVEHRTIADLPAVLAPGDLLVRNRSRVVQARFIGARRDTGGKVEGLYLRDAGQPGRWIAMLKSRRFRAGALVDLHGSDGRPSGFELTMLDRAEGVEPGAWIVEVRDAAGNPANTIDALASVGRPPLPPYILAARRRDEAPEDDSRDTERYQTIYAREPGSVAAPTAGLHFSPTLDASLRDRGITLEDVILHVGTGTFRTVETEHVEAHPMHAERCSLTPVAREAIASRLDASSAGRVIAVGTTAARTMEAHAQAQAHAQAMLAGGEGNGPEWIETDILITPGYKWRWTQGMLTNFHLPRSTLMAMVGALLPGGVEQLKALYALAIEREYRFYSFGDAMLLLPSRGNPPSNTQGDPPAESAG